MRAPTSSSNWWSSAVLAAGDTTVCPYSTASNNFPFPTCTSGLVSRSRVDWQQESGDWICPPRLENNNKKKLLTRRQQALEDRQTHQLRKFLCQQTEVNVGSDGEYSRLQLLAQGECGIDVPPADVLRHSLQARLLCTLRLRYACGATQGISSHKCRRVPVSMMGAILKDELPNQGLQQQERRGGKPCWESGQEA